MPSNKILERSLLTVEINGTQSDKRAAAFSLITQKGFPSVMAKLYYPAPSKEGKKGDKISVWLTKKEKKDLYFTGTVVKAENIDNYRLLFLADGFHAVSTTHFLAAYRKEKAAVIIDDMLAAAGIENKKIKVEDIELARFSTQNLTVKRILDILVDALKAHSVKNAVYFFDEENCFHFGEEADVRKKSDIKFTSGKDIFSKGSDWIETLPAPIRHSMLISVDGVSMETIRTELTVKEKHSRLIIHIKSAK